MMPGRPLAVLTGLKKESLSSSPVDYTSQSLVVIAAPADGCFLLLSFVVVHTFGGRLLLRRNGRRRHPVMLVESNAT
jgi:uncharacterized RDD family membrane protein YckC